jgi:hypothetical protein
MPLVVFLKQYMQSLGLPQIRSSAGLQCSNLCVEVLHYMCTFTAISSLVFCFAVRQHAFRSALTSLRPTFVISCTPRSSSGISSLQLLFSVHRFYLTPSFISYALQMEKLFLCKISVILGLACFIEVCSPHIEVCSPHIELCSPRIEVCSPYI